jgi:hypothetical protein
MTDYKSWFLVAEPRYEPRSSEPQPPEQISSKQRDIRTSYMQRHLAGLTANRGTSLLFSHTCMMST